MKSYKILIASLFGLATLAACQQEEPQDSQTEAAVNKEMTFTAVAPSDANIPAFEWEADGSISVFDGKANWEFVTDDGGAEAEFYGTANSLATEYFAFSPYCEGNRYSGKLRTVIPTEQVAVKGGIDPLANFMVAKASGKSFNFVPALAYIKINVNVADVAAVTITSNNGENLTGNVEVLIAAQPEVTEYTAKVRYNNVTLKSANGNALAQGAYYVAVMPQTLAQGYTITLTDVTGAKGDQIVSGTANFKVGTVAEAGSLEKVKVTATVKQAKLIKLTLKETEFNMVGEPGFEDYTDKSLSYCCPWNFAEFGDQSLYKYYDSPLSGAASARVDVPVPGVWYEAVQPIAYPAGIDIEYAFTEGTMTPHSYTFVQGNGGSGQRNEQRVFQNPEGAEMAIGAWNEPRRYSITMNKPNDFWAWVGFGGWGDANCFVVADDFMLRPVGYSAKSFTKGSIDLFDIKNNGEAIDGLSKMVAWKADDDSYKTVSFNLVSDGKTYETAISETAGQDLSSGLVLDKTYLQNIGTVEGNLLPMCAFALNGKTYIYYNAVSEFINNRDWRTTYTGFLVSEDSGKTWTVAQDKWYIDLGKAPFEWFSDVSITLGNDGYVYMMRCRWGQDPNYLANYFMSRCDASKDITVMANWEWRTQFGWSYNKEDAGSPAAIILAAVSEPSFIYNSKHGVYMMVYYSPRLRGLVYRDAAQPQGPWSGEKILTNDETDGTYVAPSIINVDADGNLWLIANKL